MARLLVLLACARGAAGIMDALDIKAVCDVPTDGGPRKIYLDMDAEAFETLAGLPGHVSSPETTDRVLGRFINFSPGGHPAWDGMAHRRARAFETRPPHLPVAPPVCALRVPSKPHRLS